MLREGFAQFSRSLLVAAIFALSADAASGADITAVAPSEATPDARFEAEWDFPVLPFYGWIPGVKGEVAVFGQPRTQIDLTPIDILENLDGFIDVLESVYFGAGHVRRNKIGFAWDLVHLDVFSTNQIGGDFISGNLDVGFTQTMATLMGTYRIHDSPTASVDAMAGVRISHVDLNVGVVLGPIGLSSRDGDTWVDPMVGLRGRTFLSERFYLDGWAMIGGFGVESELQWDAYAVLGYEVNNWLSAHAGFRGVGSNYQEGPFEWDVIMYGPVVGFGLRW